MIPSLTGGFTAQDILNRASEIGNNPEVAASGGQGLDYLNFVLSSVYRKFNFDFARKSTTVTFQIGSTKEALPSDFLRVIDATYQVNDVTWTLDEIDLVTYDELPIVQFNSNIPFDITVDLLNQNLIIYPTPTIVMPVQLRYFYLPPSLTDPTQYPFFPFDYWLVRAVALWVSLLQDDDREDKWNAWLDSEMHNLLKNAESVPGQTATMVLSPEWFGHGRRIKGSKAFGPQQ